MIFYDTETCGLHGLAVLIQYAEDNGPVQLYNVWRNPVKDTLNLIEYLMDHELCGFNLAFDHFHLCKLYTIFSLATTEYPDIQEIYELEPEGRNGPCVKPKSACDIMLHAQKGKYQNTMDRRNITIKRIPVAISYNVHEALEKIKIDDIFFARRKISGPKWKIEDTDDPDFINIVLRFKASHALKNLAIHALKTDAIFHKELPTPLAPMELGYAPFAKACKSMTWNHVIHNHISFWDSNPLARKYAEQDVIITRDLYNYFGRPEPGDDDSVLACAVGAIRWHGYDVNLNGILELRNEAKEISDATPKAPNAVKKYLLEVMDEIESIVINESTKKLVLEEISTWGTDASVRAQEVLNARKAKSECDLYDKLLLAKKFHTSFKIIGARSSRMSGSDRLNPQGIKRAKHVREQFPMCNGDMVLCGGDFDSFEVVLALAYYGDKELEKEVKSGKKIHAIFGTYLYPGSSYKDILNDPVKYNTSKSGVFSMIYGGDAGTLKSRLGINLEVAEKAFQNFIKKYPGIAEGRQKIYEMFCSMRQPGGIGTKVEWYEPNEYIDSMFGFKRYFTLENLICKTLFDLANKPPKHWKEYKGKIIRRDREQTLSGACQSALYAAAFALQSANTRAAGNHVIQSPGAQITKKVQRKIWDIQPFGINPWLVLPLNMHDEILSPVHKTKVNEVKEIVEGTVESFRSKVPLISLTWKTNLKSWADK
jgi:hypothetical protein